MTSHSSAFNIKPRKLWCPTCKTTVISTVPAGACNKCGDKLITVIRDELVTGLNKSTR